jgi:hypothetical protein
MVVLLAEYVLIQFGRRRGISPHAGSRRLSGTAVDIGYSPSHQEFKKKIFSTPRDKDGPDIVPLYFCCQNKCQIFRRCQVFYPFFYPF